MDKKELTTEEINNLIAKVQGRDLTLRQCADATRELNQIILYVEELEQLQLHHVIVPKSTFYCDCVQPSMQKPISETEYECFDCGKEVKQ